MHLWIVHQTGRLAWESPERVGENLGAAGAAFGAEDHRWQAGGQRVRGLTAIAAVGDGSDGDFPGCQFIFHGV